MNEPLRLLIIEDDADTRANLRDILELDGHLHAHRVDHLGAAEYTPETAIEVNVLTSAA